MDVVAEEYSGVSHMPMPSCRWGRNGGRGILDASVVGTPLLLLCLVPY